MCITVCTQVVYHCKVLTWENRQRDKELLEDSFQEERQIIQEARKAKSPNSKTTATTTRGTATG